MNQRQPSPHYFNNRDQTPRPNHGDRGSMNSPSNNWQSPWRRQPNFPQSNRFPSNGGPARNNWRGNNNSPYHSFNSPNRNSFSPQVRSSNSTPSRYSSGHNSSSDNSGFLPFTPSPRRHWSPYPRRGHHSQGRKSFDRSFPQQNQPQEPIEAYFKPSMLRDPWENCQLSSIADTEAKKNSVSSKSRRYFTD